MNSIPLPVLAPGPVGFPSLEAPNGANGASDEPTHARSNFPVFQTMSSDYEDFALPEMSKDTLSKPLVYVKRLLAEDDLLHHGGILAVATVLSGGLNYVFQVFMGRALGPEEYGIFGALFAVFYLIGILGSGIRFSATRLLAELDGQGRGQSRHHRGLVARAILLGCVIAGLLLLASPVVSRFLGMASIWPVVIIAFSVPFTFAVSVNMGSFQGLQLFGLLGSYNVLQASVKLVAGVLLVLVGFGVFGAFGAIVLAGSAVLGLTTHHVRRHLDPHGPSPRSRSTNYADVYRFLPPAVLTGFCLTVPANVDVIIVKHFFTSQQAGLYTATTILGKALVFLPMGISAALFPKVTGDRANGNAVRLNSLFDRAMLYSGVVAGGCALVYWLFPSIVLEALFGDAYTAAAPLVRWYGVAILSYVLAVVVLNFELARGRMRFVYAFTAVTVLEIALMWTLHGSMMNIIQVIFSVNAGLLLYGIVEVKG